MFLDVDCLKEIDNHVKVISELVTKLHEDKNVVQARVLINLLQNTISEMKNEHVNQDTRDKSDIIIQKIEALSEVIQEKFEVPIKNDENPYDNVDMKQDEFEVPLNQISMIGKEEDFTVVSRKKKEEIAETQYNKDDHKKVWNNAQEKLANKYFEALMKTTKNVESVFNILNKTNKINFTLSLLESDLVYSESVQNIVYVFDNKRFMDNDKFQSRVQTFFEESLEVYSIMLKFKKLVNQSQEVVIIYNPLYLAYEILLEDYEHAFSDFNFDLENKKCRSDNKYKYIKVMPYENSNIEIKTTETYKYNKMDLIKSDEFIELFKRHFLKLMPNAYFYIKNGMNKQIINILHNYNKN